jgi:hypothetical protein
MKPLITITLLAATAIASLNVATAQTEPRELSQDYWSTPHHVRQHPLPTPRSNYPRGYFDSNHGAMTVYSRLTSQEQVSYDENGVESGRLRFGTYHGRAIYCWKNRRGTFAYCADHVRR